MSLEQLIADCQARVNRLLDLQLPTGDSTPSRLHQAMRYSALDAGKRLRPLLVYACGNSFAAEQTDLDACALAIECIHVYSLIHDDLPAMDDDELRRGKPTCHIKYDEATAILAGDALQSLAFELLIRHPFSQAARAHQLAMLETLAVASGSLGMGGGQMIDLEATGKQQTLDDLQQMHRMKTGALIQASIRLGYLAANITEPEVISRLDRYSDLIGLAFQVKDDILDVEADTATLGKPSGSDQAANKSTFVALMGLAGAKAYAAQLVKEAKLALTEIAADTERLEQIADFIISRKH